MGPAGSKPVSTSCALADKALASFVGKDELFRGALSSALCG